MCLCIVCLLLILFFIGVCHFHISVFFLVFLLLLYHVSGIFLFNILALEADVIYKDASDCVF